MPVDVLVPPLGTNVDTLTLISWYKQEGEMVAKNELLFAVQTDKAALDVESPASGILCRVSAQPGAEIAVLSRIATIRAPEEAAELGADLQHSPVPHTTKALSISAGARGPREPVSEQHDGRIFISPRAKRLAEARALDWRSLRGTGPEGAIVERDILSQRPDVRPRAVSPVAQRMAEQSGVDWTQLSGSGPGGKVVREDVEQAAAVAKTTDPRAPFAERGDEHILDVVPLSGVRGIIAARLMHSVTTTAPVTLTAEADATALVELRSQLAADGLAISYNALLMKILARALQEHPRMNASLEGEVIKLWREVNIGLAVDSEQGLRVPVLRGVDRRGLQEIENEIRTLAEAARQGKTLPEEMRGGTFTLTNLGMFGIDAFTPIINLPECGILGVGRIKPQPSLIAEKLVVRQKVWLSLTFDHRLIDGGPAARFLQRVTQLVEKPHLLLG